MKINKLGYLISAGLFALIGVFSKLTGKGGSEGATKVAENKDYFIVCLALAVVSLLFFLLFNVKWKQESKDALTKAGENGKQFIKVIPLSFLWNLSFIWVITIAISALIPFITTITKLPIPTFISPVLLNIATLFFIMSAFVSILGGSYKQVASGSAIFAIIQLLTLAITFFSTKQFVAVNAINFIVFWSLFNIFSVYSKDSEPTEVEKVKTPKTSKKKKDPKKKLTKEEEDIEAQNAKAVEKFIENKEAKTEEVK